MTPEHAAEEIVEHLALRHARVLDAIEPDVARALRTMVLNMSPDWFWERAPIRRRRKQRT